MSGENHFSGVVAGEKHTGKSTFIKEKFINKFNAAGKKCLILCDSSPTAYEGIPRIKTYNGLTNFLKQKETKTAMFYDNMDPNGMIVKLRQLAMEELLYNMLMVCEDATAYFDVNPTKPQKAFLTNNRNSKLDILYTFHAIVDVPKFMWRQTTMFCCKKTGDNNRDNIMLKEMIPRTKHAEKIFSVWKQVMASPDHYETKTIFL